MPHPGKRLGVSALALAVLLSTLAGFRPANAAGEAPLVLGTIQTDQTFSGKWIRKVYGEAFRRLGIALQINDYPTQRLSALSDQGAIDGDVARVHGYAAAHPELVRVEEPVMEVVFALFTTNPDLMLKRLEDLPASGLQGTYVRGVAICANILKPFLSADRLVDTTEEAQGLSMMLAGRIDFYCSSDLSMQSMRQLPAFRNATTLRVLLALDKSVPFHAYLHRRHAALAPRLASVIKAMKSEGAIERYRLDALKESGEASAPSELKR